MANVTATVTPAALAQSAVKYKQELLLAAVFGMDTLYNNFTLRKGVQYKETIAAFDYSGEPRPYTITTKNGGKITITGRDLETHIGQIWDNFNPVDLIKTIFAGPGTENLKDTEVSKALLTTMSNKVCNALVKHVWDAKFNADGTKAVDVFDGFDTITAAEIQKTTISEVNKNLLKLKETLTEVNIVDKFQEMYAAADENLQDKACNVYVSREIYNMYHRGLKLEGNGIAYYDKYEQDVIEGTNGMWKLVPQIGKKGSKFITVTPKVNAYIGTNGKDPEKETIDISRNEHPHVLNYYLSFFFGTQFASISREDLLVVELHAGA